MKPFFSKLITKKLTGRLYLPNYRKCTSGVVPNAPLSTNTASGLLGGAVEPWSRRRRQEEWSPFLSIFARSWKTITMLDHYVNYPEKTTILTERQPYLSSRPLNSDISSDMCDNQDGNKTPPIVVG